MWHGKYVPRVENAREREKQFEYSCRGLLLWRPSALTIFGQNDANL